MDTSCYIVMDLLPLYTENLLSEETTTWVKNHLDICTECRKLYEYSSEEIIKIPVENSMDKDLMFKNINRKLSIYQIIFVAISFFFAINTSLLNESFGFLLWYPVLGIVTYLFYKDMQIIFLLSFIPIFLWTLPTMILDFILNGYIGSYLSPTFIKFVIGSIFSSFMISFVYFIFAFIGGMIGFLILKLKTKDKVSSKK
ncbi:MAG: zf-HC2 domain-containing protein [Clostridium sp.]|uniref:zf-HC2 domain-containing protein n=1 Tax=Clostridium sp. TaxID=1506 RepID=UPI0030413352